VIKALDTALKDPQMHDEEVKDVSAETSAPAQANSLVVKVQRPSWGARRADALGRMAESFLQHGAEALNPGERQQIVVHVDLETLREGGAGRCELEDGPSLAAETVRRLGCDASVVSIVESEQGEPLNVGRKTRTIPPGIRRALNARDRGCRFPGCTNTRYVDAHHVQHWVQGGETKLSNLVNLCKFHHRQVHEGRVVIEPLDDGALRFLRPDGQSFESVAPEHTRPLSDWRELAATHDQQGVRIDPTTATTRWRGERMDYGLAVQSLILRAERGQRVSAETSAQRHCT